METIWGIDLGGTKIEGVILGKARRETLFRKRVLTSSGKGYVHILSKIEMLVKEMAAKAGNLPGVICIGTPGSLEPSTGNLKNSNTVCLNGKPIKSDLEKILKVKIRIANDANCFALAETKMGIITGKVPDASVVFGIIMGTGVGGGIVVNDTVINGKHGIAGEWGHNFLDDSGGNCYCGRTGCVETLISGKALEKYYHGQVGEHKPLEEIYKLSRSKDNKVSQETLERLYKYFGKAVAVVINILDPDAIVIGGGLGNIDELYTRGVAETKKYVFNTTLTTPFLKPSLGDSAGVYGAALLCL